MDAERLIAAIEAAEIRDCDELRPQSYSGRSMYGRSCVGVVVPRDVSSFQLAAAIAVALLDEEDGDRDVQDLADLRVCEDNMGLDTIVYFPRVEWPAGRSEDDEDEEHDCEGPSCCTPTGSEAAAE